MQLVIYMCVVCIGREKKEEQHAPPPHPPHPFLPSPLSTLLSICSKNPPISPWKPPFLVDFSLYRMWLSLVCPSGVRLELARSKVWVCACSCSRIQEIGILWVFYLFMSCMVVIVVIDVIELGTKIRKFKI